MLYDIRLRIRYTTVRYTLGFSLSTFKKVLGI